MSTTSPELRRRAKAAGELSDGTPIPPRTSSRKKEESEDQGITAVDIFRIIAGLIALNCLLSYFVTNDSVTWGYRPWYIRPKAVMRWAQGPIILTDAELLAYDGRDPAKPIYLALNGTIYDVTAGKYVYGPGGPYSVFAGKDAARGFITGCFAEDANADLRGAEWTYMPADIPTVDQERKEKIKMTRQEVMGRMKELAKARKQVKATLEGWAKTFSGDSGKDYFEVGTVKRDPDWLENEPLKPICEQALKNRPERGEAAVDAGAEHRS